MTLSPEDLDAIRERAENSGEDRAEFLQIAQEDIPALLAEVERLRALVPEPPTEDEREALAVLLGADAVTAHFEGTKAREFRRTEALRQADVILEAGFRLPRPPDRETIVRALYGFDIHMQSGNRSHVILGRYEAGQIADAVIAAITEKEE